MDGWLHPIFIPETTSVWPSDACPYCSNDWSWTIHNGKCPKVAEYEYHPNGTLKRVRFHP